MPEEHADDVALAAALDGRPTSAWAAAQLHFASAGRRFLELHDRQGWAALGYPSWEAYCAAEFAELDQGFIDRLVDRARWDGF
jgi:hypothetical protein